MRRQADDNVASLARTLLIHPVAAFWKFSRNELQSCDGRFLFGCSLAKSARFSHNLEDNHLAVRRTKIQDLGRFCNFSSYAYTEEVVLT